jgi:RNA polymerase sigma-70 factor (ECF subfamily)
MAAIPVPAPDPALEREIAAHRDALYARARQLCRGSIDADDLVQDVLERALRGSAGLRDPARVRAWLFTILTRSFIDRIRHQRALPQHEVLDDAGAAAPPADERPAWQRLTADQLRVAVERLPVELRDTYRLHALDGRDYDDIARAQGIPKATVGTRLLRARKRLRAILGEGLDDGGGR